MKIKHKSGKCTSSKDSLQLFFDKDKNRWTGFCFSCEAKGLEAYVAKPFEDGEQVPEKPKEKTREEIELELSEVTQLPLVDMNFRNIPKEYFKKYKVRLALSEFDGKTPASFAFPRTASGKLKSYKFKTLKQKYQWMVGEGRNCDLLGWERAKSSGNQRLYITEGEWDWLSLEYLLDKYGGDKYSGKYAVTSLPDGAGSAAVVINRMLPEIKKYFKEVVLVFDNDEEGRHAVREVQKVYPEVLTAPPFVACKDANEVLQTMTDRGCDMFVKGVLFNSKKPALEGVVNIAEILSRGDIVSTRGLSYPWPTIDEALQGQTFGDAGVIAGGVGSGKCQGYGTPILMYDGSIKAVQDVVVGDLLMGDDSTSREVLSTVVGRDEMFKVIPVKGETYTFNKDHILAIYMTKSNREYLKDADGFKHYSGCKSTITVDTYIRSSNQFKKNAKLYRVAVDFKDCFDDLPIPPYILGVWLGDGSTDYAAITTKDSVVKNAWIEWGTSLGCDYRTESGRGCETIYLKTERGQDNPALELLRSLGVLGNKHVPKQYKTASKQSRLELLAGILDTDGSLKNNCFDLTLKIKDLAEDVSFITKSVGLYSKVVECKKTIKSLSFEGSYFRQSISGEVDIIPTKLKKAGKRYQTKDVKITGFTVEPIGVDNYYGFELSGNRLYVLGDFIVTHNTAIVHELIAHNAMAHGVPCFAALLEEENRKSVRNICSKIDSIPYNNPNQFEANKDRCYETARQLQNKVLLWNSAGNTQQRFDIEAIVAAIRYNYHEYGVKFAYIDNMTKLVDGLDSSKANEFINRWSSELSNLASELNIRIELLSHLNAPIKGIDHEHGGEVKLSQLTGSKGIMRNFSVGIGFERNQYATKGREQNSLMRVLKNREHSIKPVAKTQYSLMTGRLLEFNWEGDSLIEE